jgi:hypothetical protein
MSGQAFFDEGGIGYSVLRGLKSLAPYWTLHGGASLIYHLGHRAPGDLDFFCEAASWSESAAEFTAGVIIPSNFPDAGGLRKKAADTWLDPALGTFKLTFEKITLSFIRYPRVSGTVSRVISDGCLPVASLEDIVVLKLVVLAYRRSLVDYRDWVSILAHGGFSIPAIIAAAERRRHVYRHLDLPLCLELLGQVPAQGREDLSREEKCRLRCASEEGLRLCRPD